MSTPLIFKTLELRNFLSYGNEMQTLYLADQGTVEITGENADQGTGSGNGSGKSSLIEALCYVLFNKAFSNISLQRLPNRTNSLKNTLMEVRLTFEKDGIEYEIYRARGEEYKIEVHKNGVDITPGKGVYETDAMIQEIIGISYELFTKTIIFSGASPAFLQLPIHAQRLQIEELFNITLLSEKAKILKERIRSTEGDIKVAEAIVKQQELAIELHIKHIREAKARIDRWEEAHQKEIAEIERTLLKITEVDFEGEQLLHDEKERLQQEGMYLAAKLSPAKKDRTLLTNGIQKLLTEQEQLQDARCPYCTQKYANAAEKLSEIEKELEENGSKLLKLEDNVIQLEKDEDFRKTRLLEVQKSIKHMDLRELITARTNSVVLQERIQELKTALNPHFEAHEKLCSEKTDEVNTTRVDILRRRLDHQHFLLKLLTDKNSFLRRRIINKSIPFLNARLNFYTNALGLPHVVKFDADMSCTVTEFSRELDFGNLSAGERHRVNTSMMLAFRDVLQHLHAKCSLLLIDELDGSLDQQGVDAIIRVLKEKSRVDDISIFVISHHPAVTGRLSKSLRIIKESGFSRIESE